LGGVFSAGFWWLDFFGGIAAKPYIRGFGGGFGCAYIISHFADFPPWFGRDFVFDIGKGFPKIGVPKIC